MQAMPVSDQSDVIRHNKLAIIVTNYLFGTANIKIFVTCDCSNL